MDFIDKLNNASSNTNSLTSFLQKHHQAAFDFFFSQSYSILKRSSKKINKYIQSNFKVLRNLDLNINENYAFILLLLDVCERFSFRLYFKRLYRILESSNCQISLRHNAAALFLNDIKEFSDYEKILLDFLNKLSSAYELEEDNIDRILATFANFYAQVVYDFGQFNPNGVLALKERLHQLKNDYFFLNYEIINRILSLNTSDFINAYLEIHNILDIYFKRNEIKFTFKDVACLIETETEYCNLLSNVGISFREIRQISVKNSDGSEQLGRGVEILNNEDQLYCYMRRFGNMHYAKMSSALEKIDFNKINKQVEVFDWGCGQGLASIVLFEKYKLNASSISLIDPSKVSLKRASLHIQHVIKQEVTIRTICKKLNDLIPDDLKTDSGKIKIHLFSNILDIDGYSQNYLIETIITSFKGLNYFICISPFITELKALRLDSFMKYFKNKYENFEKLGEETNKTDNKYWNCNNNFNGNLGVYCEHNEYGCNQKWTRVLRVFKVNM